MIAVKTRMNSSATLPQLQYFSCFYVYRSFSQRQGSVFEFVPALTFVATISGGGSVAVLVLHSGSSSELRSILASKSQLLTLHCPRLHVRASGPRLFVEFSFFDELFVIY